MRKRSRLPKDFEQQLTTASSAQLHAVFERCALDARGGYSDSTALGFLECPDELMTWLVGQGLDVDTPDRYGATPLWERASMGWDAQIPLLVSLGADIQRTCRGGQSPLHAAAGDQRTAVVKVLLDQGAQPRAVDDEHQTPLLLALRETQNGTIDRMAEVAKLLLDAGDSVTLDMREAVADIGREFEFHRADFNPDYLQETDDALGALYDLFGVTPVGPRRQHDGTALIVAPPGPWQSRHQALWELLVPSSGPAATVQGEVIRLSGRISREILDNGSMNWDDDFAAMLRSLCDMFTTGRPLPRTEIQESQLLAGELRWGRGDESGVNRLAELAVDWVAANPTPTALRSVPYDR